MIIKKSFRGHESRLNSELTICMEKADAAKVALITTVNTSHIIFPINALKCSQTLPTQSRGLVQ